MPGHAVAPFHAMPLAQAGAPWGHGAPAALAPRYAGPYLICNDGALAVVDTVKWSHMPAAIWPGTRQARK